MLGVELLPPLLLFNASVSLLFHRAKKVQHSLYSWSVQRRMTRLYILSVVTCKSSHSVNAFALEKHIEEMNAFFCASLAVAA